MAARTKIEGGTKFADTFHIDNITHAKVYPGGGADTFYFGNNQTDVLIHSEAGYLEGNQIFGFNETDSFKLKDYDIGSVQLINRGGGNYTLIDALGHRDDFYLDGSTLGTDDIVFV